MALTVYSPGDVLTASSLNDNLSFAAAASNDNVVINGAMQVHQRGTSTASITTGGYYTADRFVTDLVTMGTWTQTVENDAPTGSGFRKSLKMECTTADASPAAADVLLIAQRVEGLNLQQFLKGTAEAKQFTVSFYVKASLTGTYIVMLADVPNSRTVSIAYTVVASNTWEEKTITFPADTTGEFNNDNVQNLQVRWFLGAGSDRTSGTLNTTWQTSVAANTAVGQVNLAGATNRTWQITGVKLEVGGQATPFPFEDIGVTLAKCQRYFETSYNIGVKSGTANSVGPVILCQDRSSADGAGSFGHFGFATFKVKKRASPSISVFSQAGTTNKFTTNRWGNSGTAGFYNAYVAVSADSSGGVLASDIGESHIVFRGSTSAETTLNFGVVHFVADSEI